MLKRVLKVSPEMADKLTSCAVVSYVFILVGLGLHVAGFVTVYWMTGESKDDSGKLYAKNHHDYILEVFTRLDKNSELYLSLQVLECGLIVNDCVLYLFVFRLSPHFHSVDRRNLSFLGTSRSSVLQRF